MSSGRLKGLSQIVQSCLLYRSCMSKDSARSTGHVGHFSPKYCVPCKKSTLKVLINLGFVTSFEDSHYIPLLFRCSDTFMARNLYSGFAIQNTFMTTAIIGWMLLQRHYLLSAILLMSLSLFAQLPTLRSNIFSAKTLLAFWVIPNWFSKFCSQNDYLNSKLYNVKVGQSL